MLIRALTCISFGITSRSSAMRQRCARGMLCLLAMLTACGPRSDADAPGHNSGGQVTPAPVASVSHFAAARFAEQVSFGANPALVSEIESKGFSRWIDDQFALPVSKIDASPIRVFDDTQADFVYSYAFVQLYGAQLAAPDQLRQRVSWSLSQFVTTSMEKTGPYAALKYANFLQDHAFGNYAGLIRDLSLNPVMGVYLDNIQNRPTTANCPTCAPNENYARELMQLFTLGVAKLNADGSIQRDANGKALETYTQDDVEEMARALTGWTFAHEIPIPDYGRYDDNMIADPNSGSHDTGAKSVLRNSIAAGGTPAQDLNRVVTILLQHQNIAPFVSLRLIQHLVTSNPGPAYVARVAAVFRNNGQGVAGDMKAVLKAVLLDADARRGDVPGSDLAGFGKVREPVLWYSSLLRGLGCSKPLRWNESANAGVAAPDIQRPLDATSVFSFYVPTDRAPGSNLLSPEQRLLTAPEMAGRFGGYRLEVPAATSAAGCRIDEFTAALGKSANTLLDLISERYFRGALPATLRQTLLDLAAQTSGTAQAKAMLLLQFALASPYYGAMQ